jgi:hypothetical protein
MDEHENDQEQHPPRWVPYTPPAADGWDRVRILLRRLSFPVGVLLLALGVGGVFYWTAQQEPVEGEAPTVNVMPSGIGMGEGAERAAATGTAHLRVRSSPSGATVRVNGDSVGVTPFTDSARTAGVFLLSVQRKDHFRADSVVVLEDGSTASVRFSLRPRPGVTRPATAEAPSRSERPSAAPEERQQRRPPPVTSVPSTAADTPPEPTPVYGALYVTSVPSGAVVTVNGTERGRTPLPLNRISPGSQRLAVSLDGYQPWTTQVDVTADTLARVHAQLRARTGRLRVLARPWGTIYIDGTLHARESDVWYETDLPVGRHQITVVHPALGERTQYVGISAAEETSLVVDLRDEEQGSSP